MTNIGAIIALWLFSTWSKPPHYKEGTIVLLVSACMMAVLSLGNYVYLRSQNQRKARTREQSNKEDEIPGFGDRSAWFIYSL